MSIALWKPFKFLINTVPIPFTNVGLDSNFDIFLQQNGIQIDPTYASVRSIAPVISVDTLDVSLAISTIGIAGLASTTFEMWFVPITSGAVAVPAAGAMKVSGTVGLAMLGSITGDGGENATEASATIELHALGTASVAPFLVSSAQTPPAAVELAATYYLGPVTFNGRTYDPTNLSINPGLEIAKRQSDGLAWHTFASFPRRASTIEISTEQVLALDDMTATAGADEIEGGIITDFVAYLRKSTIGITRVANATAEHVKLTVAKAMIVPGSTGGALDGFATQSVTITPLSTGGNPSMAFSVVSAIT